MNQKASSSQKWHSLKSNSYRENSERRIKAFQDNMSKPLLHKQRRDKIQ
jgi:hypothetical protein